MTLGGWRFAAASVIGTSHIKLSTPCQDANDCQMLSSRGGESILATVVSDGAGSAELSQEGSALTCRELMGHIVDHISGGNTIQQITREVASSWIANLQGQIAVRADAVGKTARDFACTLIAAVIGEFHSVFLQLGDGAIVVSDEDLQYRHIFWPERGEYENTTYFITQEIAIDHHLQFDSVQNSFSDVAVFSDGIQRLALDYRSETPHGPFFRDVFFPLRSVSEGRSADLSRSLAEFLASSRVNSRTDDDKTLVIASRPILDNQEHESSANPTR